METGNEGAGCVGKGISRVCPRTHHPGGNRVTGGSGQLFDPSEVFDDDYLYFYAGTLGDERSDAETDLISSLGPVNEGDRVLDLACGHGRIANRLAERGASVTGLDVSSHFLELARRGAAERAATVEYVLGDMTDLPWSNEFDRVVSWFTSFGYLDDAGNRRVLEEIHRSLRPGGRVLLDLNQGPSWGGRLPRSSVVKRGDDLMVDQLTYDPMNGRSHNQRTIVRDGRVRTVVFEVRMFTFVELRDWLLGVGFRRAEGFGRDGAPLTLPSRRMIVRATR